MSTNSKMTMSECLNPKTFVGEKVRLQQLRFRRRMKLPPKMKRPLVGAEKYEEIRRIRHVNFEGCLEEYPDELRCTGDWWGKVRHQ